MAWHQIYHKTLPELILNTMYDDILLCLYSREVGFTHVTIYIWGITWYTFVPMQPWQIIYCNYNGNRIRCCGYLRVLLTFISFCYIIVFHICFHPSVMAFSYHIPFWMIRDTDFLFFQQTFDLNISHELMFCLLWLSSWSREAITLHPYH